MNAAPGAGGRIALPLAAICCLGLLGFLVAATIIIALIPLYLPTATVSSSSSSSNSPFYAEYSGSPTSGNPTSDVAGSVSSPNSVAQSMGVSSNGQFSTGNAKPAITRRKRGGAYERNKRTLVTKFVFYVTPLYNSSCTSTSCRTSAYNSLQQSLQSFASAVPITISANSTYNVSDTYTLTFISFYSSLPSGYANVTTSSSSFVPIKSGNFNDSTIWSGGFIPYGNCTVTIPSGYTVTIPGSKLEVRVTSFDISGTLAVGQGSSTFQFVYATTIIVESGGTLTNLATGNTMTLAQDSYVVSTSSGTINNSTVIVGGVSNKRLTGTSFQCGRGMGTFTGCPMATETISVTIVEHIARYSGTFFSRTTYYGNYMPSITSCLTSAPCSLLILSGVTLSTSDTAGGISLPISTITVRSGATLNLVSTSTGFQFSYAVMIEVYGSVVYSGSGNVIKMPVNSQFNLFSGSTFSGSSGSVIIQAIDANGNSFGTPLSISNGQTGPFYVSIPTSGIVQYSTTTPGGSNGNSTTTTTAAMTTFIFG